MLYSLLLHWNDGGTNSSHCYVIRTLPVLCQMSAYNVAEHLWCLWQISIGRSDFSYRQNNTTFKSTDQVFLLGHRAHHPLSCQLSSTTQYEQSAPKVPHQEWYLVISTHNHLHDRYIVLINHLKPTGYVMHQQFNIQQLYALPTLYLCVLYLSENRQRLVPLTA